MSQCLPETCLCLEQKTRVRCVPHHKWLSKSMEVIFRAFKKYFKPERWWYAAYIRII